MEESQIFEHSIRRREISFHNDLQSHMTCRACVQLPLYVYWIYDNINTQMLRTSHDLLFHLADLDNGREPDIRTLDKEKGDIFS